MRLVITRDKYDAVLLDLDKYDAVLLDLDGVITETAKLHGPLPAAMVPVTTMVM